MPPGTKALTVIPVAVLGGVAPMEAFPLPSRATRACGGDPTQEQLVRRLLMRDTTPLPEPLDAVPPTVGRTPADKPPPSTPHRPTKVGRILAAAADKGDAMAEARERGLALIAETRTAHRGVDPDLFCLACGEARVPQPAVDIRCGSCGAILDTPTWLGRPGENGSSVHNFHRRPVEEKPLDGPAIGEVIPGPTGPTTTTRGLK